MWVCLCVLNKEIWVCLRSYMEIRAYWSSSAEMWVCLCLNKEMWACLNLYCMQRCKCVIESIFGNVGVSEFMKFECVFESLYENERVCLPGHRWECCCVHAWASSEYEEGNHSNLNMHVYFHNVIWISFFFFLLKTNFEVRVLLVCCKGVSELINGFRDTPIWPAPPPRPPPPVCSTMSKSTRSFNWSDNLHVIDGQETAGQAWWETWAHGRSENLICHSKP